MTDDISVVKQQVLSSLKCAYDVVVHQKVMGAQGDLLSSSNRQGQLMGVKSV